MPAARTPMERPNAAVATHSPMTTARRGRAAPKTRPNSKGQCHLRVRVAGDHKDGGRGEDEQYAREDVGCAQGAGEDGEEERPGRVRSPAMAAYRVTVPWRK